MKKLLLTFTTLSLLLGGAGVAAADRDDRRHRDRDRGDYRWSDGDRYQDGHWVRERRRDGVIARQRVYDRRGTIYFDVDGAARRADLQLASNDRDLVIRSVLVTFGNGRTARLYPRRGASVIDLPDRRIEAIEVHYVNRGARRDAEIAVLARR